MCRTCSAFCPRRAAGATRGRQPGRRDSHPGAGRTAGRLPRRLIEVPRLTREPQTKKDLAIGRERGTAPVALGREITVIPGNPAIVVRDHLSTDTPIEVVRSNSGEFELQVFDGFYRVLDAKSGELLHERAGLDPNFSPTSRFLGAYSAGPGAGDHLE